MPYDPNIHHRHSIRLKGYDYSQEGLYFITVCCKNKVCRFGKIENGEMILNDTGKIAQQCWLEIPQHFPHAELHEYVVMPNHIHGIVELVGAKNFSPLSPSPSPSFSPASTLCANDNMDAKINNMGAKNNTMDAKNNNMGAKNFSPLHGPSRTIGSIIRGFKIGVTKQLDGSIWQRNYYEHIIRNERSYQNISNYIIHNPEKWQNDKFYSE
ncbi:MAG: transposase [Prevotellaceae bacterium]|jgi:REP element-mobilizing transposase RayT|nr:transposase [Prevotellaceae bacterium]